MIGMGRGGMRWIPAACLLIAGGTHFPARAAVGLPQVGSSRRQSRLPRCHHTPSATHHIPGCPSNAFELHAHPLGSFVPSYHRPTTLPSRFGERVSHNNLWNLKICGLPLRRLARGMHSYAKWQMALRFRSVSAPHTLPCP